MKSLKTWGFALSATGIILTIVFGLSDIFNQAAPSSNNKAIETGNVTDSIFVNNPDSTGPVIINSPDTTVINQTPTEKALYIEAPDNPAIGQTTEMAVKTIEGNIPDNINCRWSFKPDIFMQSKLSDENCKISISPPDLPPEALLNSHQGYIKFNASVSINNGKKKLNQAFILTNLGTVYVKKSNSTISYDSSVKIKALYNNTNKPIHRDYQCEWSAGFGSVIRFVPASTNNCSGTAYLERENVKKYLPPGQNRPQLTASIIYKDRVVAYAATEFRIVKR
ncbi:MAG: hypothetical protein OIF57_13855 [Marinobacterium sp.]|nr:hypothetical protein [Marinobacterium sp.]